MLPGKKTYIVVAAMIVYAIAGAFLQKFGWTDAFTLVLEAFAVAGLRLGVAKIK